MIFAALHFGLVCDLMDSYGIFTHIFGIFKTGTGEILRFPLFRKRYPEKHG